MSIGHVTVRFVVKVPVSDAEANTIADGDSDEVEDDVVRRARAIIAIPQNEVEEDIVEIVDSKGTQL